MKKLTKTALQRLQGMRSWRAMLAMTGILVAGSALPAYASAKTVQVPLPAKNVSLVWNADKKTFVTESHKEMSYRKNGQIKSITYTVAGTSDGFVDETQFQYDKKNRLTRAKKTENGNTNEFVQYDFQWSKNGNHVQITETNFEDGEKQMSGTGEITFNKNGQPTRIISRNRDGELDETTKITYTKKGGIKEKQVARYNVISEKQVQTDRFTYTKKGQIRSWKRDDEDRPVRHEYIYKKGKLVKRKNYSENSKKADSVTKYTYKGNRITVTEYSGGEKYFCTQIYDKRFKKEGTVYDNLPEILPYRLVREELEGKTGEGKSVWKHTYQAYKKGALKGLVKTDLVKTGSCSNKKPDKVKWAGKSKQTFTYVTRKMKSRDQRIQKALLDYLNQ